MILVKQLVEQLKQFDQEAPVVLTEGAIYVAVSNVYADEHEGIVQRYGRDIVVIE